GEHSKTVNISFEKDFDITDIKRMINKTPSIALKDNPDTNTYPMPIYAHVKDDVFVGIIRRGETAKNSLNLWIVADNLRKGAATNTVQIAEYLIQHQLV